MAGRPDYGSKRWLIFLVIILALIFFNRSILAGLQAVVGLVISPVMQPAASLPPTFAPAPTQPPFIEATMAPEPTRYVEATVGHIYEPITITIWHGWGEAELPAVQTALTAYTADHPNVTFDLQKQDDLVAALPVAVAAGEGPDLVAWWSSSIGWLAPEVLLPLDQQSINLASLEGDFFPAALRTVKMDGSTWGLPLSQMGMGLVYNTDLLGEDYTLPNNLEMLQEAALSYENAHPGKKFFCNPGFSSKDGYYLAPILFSTADVPGYVDAAGNVYVNQAEIVQGASRLTELARLSPADSSYEACQFAFLDGEIPTWWTGPWSIPTIEGRGIHFDVIAMGRPFVETYALMLTRSAEFRNHTAAALDVMQYLTGADAQADFTIKNQSVPASFRSLSNPMVYAMKGITDFAWALDAGLPLVANRFTDQQWSPVNQAITSILDGSQSPLDALNNAQMTIEGNIANIR